MTNRIFVLLVMLLFASGAYSQEVSYSQLQSADSLGVVERTVVDTTLLGHSIFTLVKNTGDISINQSSSVARSFEKYVGDNSKRKLNGYRIRIFFDNKQTARVQSEEVEKTFVEHFPQYPVYRTYTNPYFKVAVGDFRTKSDAVKVLFEVQAQFPKAFIIKDMINYPL